MGFLPSIPYSEAADGFWSPVTSTLNWCEEDYYFTPYAAEIVNTLTNLVFVFLGCKGISNCIRNGHDPVFLVAFISYVVIGIGSTCFHATLKYSMQLLDELSMIYTTCVLFYAVFSFGRPGHSAVLLGLSITALAVFITGYYHYLQNPVFHQNAFGFLIAAVVSRGIYAMEYIIRPSRRTNANSKLDDGNVTDQAEQEKLDRRDEQILKEMWKLVSCGIGAIAVGFLIWNLDTIFCGSFRRWRRQIGLPWGILLEGHGWWHIFTGIAGYINVTWAIWLRYCLNGKQGEVKLVWPSLLSIPVLERISKDKIR
ncbi:hypothetical protein FQN51_000058 [Onygenales sp. PD_10]|nr:hypothetical protein FQN51_000058 [Onygenales sp. PD_10]